MKGLFGDLFDFNGDGNTTSEEEFLGLCLLDTISESDNDSDDDDDEM